MAEDLAVSDQTSYMSKQSGRPYSCNGGRLGGNLEFAYKFALAK